MDYILVNDILGFHLYKLEICPFISFNSTHEIKNIIKLGALNKDTNEMSGQIYHEKMT